MILIDCPPALGLLTVNGLVAADHALISAEAQYFALQGVQGAIDVVEQAKEYYNPDLELVGVLMNIADMRTVHSREAYDVAQARRSRNKVFKTVIRSSIAYAESAESAKSILDHRPDLGVGLPRAGRRGPQARRARRPAAQAAAAARGRRVESCHAAAGSPARRAPPDRGLRRRAGAEGRARCRSRPQGEGMEEAAAAAPKPPARPLPRPPACCRAPACARRPAAASCTASACAPSSARRRVLGVTARRDGWLAVVASERPNGRVGWIPERRVALASTNCSVHVDRSARRLTLRRKGRRRSAPSRSPSAARAPRRRPAASRSPTSSTPTTPARPTAAAPSRSPATRRS